MDSYGYEEPTVSFLDQLQHWFGLGVGGLVLLFTLWMIIDAVRKGEWAWVAYMLIMPGLAAAWYFFYMFRGPTTRGFELPGANDRRRIKEQASVWLSGGARRLNVRVVFQGVQHRPNERGRMRLQGLEAGDAERSRSRAIQR